MWIWHLETQFSVAWIFTLSMSLLVEGSSIYLYLIVPLVVSGWTQPGKHDIGPGQIYTTVFHVVF